MWNNAIWSHLNYLILKIWLTFGILTPLKNVPSRKSGGGAFYIGCPPLRKVRGQIPSPPGSAATDWLINQLGLKLFSRAYDVDISDDYVKRSIGFVFFVIRFYFAFTVFIVPLLSYFYTVEHCCPYFGGGRFANLVDWLIDRYISSVFVVKPTKQQQYTVY